jgi:hypothetical protein
MLLQPVPRLLVAGVQHQNVDAAELVQGFGHQCPAVLFLLDVAGKQHGFATRLLDPARGLFGILLLLGQIADRDIRSFAGERDGDGTTDTGVTARDEGAFVLQLASAAVGLLAVVWFRLAVVV